MNVKSINSFVSSTPFYFIFVCYVGLVALVMKFNGLYKSLDYEDGFVELSGAAFLLFASIVLFKTAFDYKKNSNTKDYKFWMFLLAGAAFFWASGEEISWGQHMLKTVTPEWLGKINGQNETNLHNINKKFFDRTLERLMVLLSLITAIFYFRGKDTFLGFKLPNTSLNLAFLLIPIFRKHEDFALDVWYINFVIFWGYPVIAIVKKNHKLLLQSILFVIAAGVVLHFHHNYQTLFKVSNFYHEVRETIFAIMAFYFALELWGSVIKTDESLSSSELSSTDSRKLMA